MKPLKRSPITHWLRRGLAALILVGGLAASQAAQAADGYSTITLYAPGAPAGAWIGVEFQDPLGSWHAVEGWQGQFDTLEDTGLRLKQWAVSPDDAGQGPFRWVLYTAQGGTVWAVSESFDLPGGGANLELTVQAATPVTAAVTTGPLASTGPSVNVTGDRMQYPLVAADFSTWPLRCGQELCAYGHITAFLPDAPAGSWVGVQWQDPQGAWHLVDGWQGTASVDADGRQFAQWTVLPENFNQAGFRWVVLQPDGRVWGVSPSFRLPEAGGDRIVFLLRHGG